VRLDGDSSDRMALLRLPLVVGVVFIHAYETEVGLASGAVGIQDPGAFSVMFRDLLSEGIARVAVPLFYLMSGYLLFLGCQGTWTEYGKRLRSRARTLLVPYLFWNLSTLVLLALAQSSPIFQPYFSGRNAPVGAGGLYDHLDLVLGFDRRPISYQFWFIRDLMVLVLLAPVVHGILKTAPRLFLAAVLLLWFLGLWPVYIPSIAALCFFYAGAFLARFGFSLFGLDRFMVPMCLAFAGVLIADVLTKARPWNGFLHNAGILLGMACALGATRGLMRRDRVRRFLLWSAGSSFFVFAVHEPLLTIVRKISFGLLSPGSDFLVLFLYVSIPAVVIAISMGLYLALKALAPRFLATISGGR
jgi:peptidoglycan/LPS O-acetylase OafA/YrhL